MKQFLRVIMLLLVSVILASCSGTPMAVPTPTATPLPPSPTPAPFVLTSPTFTANGEIPARHACHGDDLSPELAWGTPPAGTQSLVLIMDDPDAVPVAGRVWDHWVLFNIPPDAAGLPEGVPPEEELADGSVHGRNSSFQSYYAGPCPPSGQTHGYVFTLYALDTRLDLAPDTAKPQIIEAIEGHVLAQTQLVGMYTSP